MSHYKLFSISTLPDLVKIEVKGHPELIYNINTVSLHALLQIAEDLLGNYMFIDLAIISAWFEAHNSVYQ